MAPDAGNGVFILMRLNSSAMLVRKTVACTCATTQPVSKLSQLVDSLEAESKQLKQNDGEAGQNFAQTLPGLIDIGVSAIKLVHGRIHYGVVILRQSHALNTCILGQSQKPTVWDHRRPVLGVDLGQISPQRVGTHELHSSSVLAFFFKLPWARYAFTATASGLRDSYLTNFPSSSTN